MVRYMWHKSLYQVSFRDTTISLPERNCLSNGFLGNRITQ